MAWLIGAAHRQQVMTEPNREELVWDPSVMNFVSEDDGVCFLMCTFIQLCRTAHLVLSDVGQCGNWV